jgi:hypothetical protein
MNHLRCWKLKRFYFYCLCVDQCADDPEMLLKALSIIGEVGAC